MNFIKIKDYLNFDGVNSTLLEKEIEEYSEYFDSVIKPAFTKEFINEYIKHHVFHDWILDSVKEHFDGKRNTVFVNLFDEYKSQYVILEYKNVKAFKCSFNHGHFKNAEHDEFGIDEFCKIEEKLFSHEVYFPSGSKYYVEFERISIKKTNQDLM